MENRMYCLGDPDLELMRLNIEAFIALQAQKQKKLAEISRIQRGEDIAEKRSVCDG